MLGKSTLTLPDYFILLPVPRNMLQEESHHDFPRDQSESDHPERPQIILLAFICFVSLIFVEIQVILSTNFHLNMRTDLNNNKSKIMMQVLLD